LSPWWLRPTSEGASNEDNETRQPASPAAPAQAPAQGAAGQQAARDAAAAAAPETTEAAALAPTAGLADGHAVAPAAPTPRWAAEPAHESQSPGAETAEPERRSFWQPRLPAPAFEGAPPVEPLLAAAHDGADSIHSADSGGAGDSAGRREHHAEPEPNWLSPAYPAAASPAHSGSHLAAHAADVPSAAANALAPITPISSALDAAADSADSDDADDAPETDAEGETEESGDDSRPGARKKRSRRSRGGRRKNGRAAAAPAGIAGAGGSPELLEDDEDDLAADELPSFAPAAALPQPFAPALPAGVAAMAPRAARSGESYVISAGDLESMSREIIISVPDRQRPQHEERKIAVFCDFENIALGVRDSEISKLDIGLILERLLEKGKIIVKKAYADWERYSDYKRPFHEAAIELIDIPQKFYSGKNSADIKMVVDAMDMSYAKEHLDTFVILSGDSDFSPLVSKLKENNKYVIGIGVKNSSSNLLVDNCDEFIYYEDIWRDAQKGPKLDGLSKKTAEAFSLMVESIQALVRENKDVLWGSMIKQTMQRKKPSFNEGYYGYSTFSELLEDAARKSIVKLKKDQRSGTYIVTGFAKSSETGPGRRLG
jgi:uncharacterized protein (TIGR00288 family)